MPASDDFTQLKEQVEKADEHIKASAAQGVDELKAIVDDARRKADARANELSTRAQEAGDNVEAHWNQVQSDQTGHQADSRTHRRQEGGARRERGGARCRGAEADAYDAIQFAQAAIEEAEYAVLDAAREKGRGRASRSPVALRSVPRTRSVIVNLNSSTGVLSPVGFFDWKGRRMSTDVTTPDTIILIHGFCDAAKLGGGKARYESRGYRVLDTCIPRLRGGGRGAER